mmetsp:Transcript_16502/g.46048  ORF Transcript_16502/g.46048 Transcript_16502/m.46048 type:complete len:233 (-) Transcript_16502:2811-3509(-)
MRRASLAVGPMPARAHLLRSGLSATGRVPSAVRVSRVSSSQSAVTCPASSPWKGGSWLMSRSSAATGSSSFDRLEMVAVYTPSRASVMRAASTLPFCAAHCAESGKPPASVGSVEPGAICAKAANGEPATIRAERTTMMTTGSPAGSLAEASCEENHSTLGQRAVAGTMGPLLEASRPRRRSPVAGSSKSALLWARSPASCLRLISTQGDGGPGPASFQPNTRTAYFLPELS